MNPARRMPECFSVPNVSDVYSCGDRCHDFCIGAFVASIGAGVFVSG